LTFRVNIAIVASTRSRNGAAIRSLTIRFEKPDPIDRDVLRGVLLPRVRTSIIGRLSLSGTLLCFLALVGAAHQEPAPSKDLIAHVTWSIYHEGCRVFFTPPGANPLEDQLRPLSELRSCFLLTQRHNPDATNLIKSASDQILTQAILTAVKDIPGLYSLPENFAWVAVHEGQLAAFRRLDKAGAYDGIRGIYATKQFHNPNARNLLAASRNRDIHQLVVDLLQSNPPVANNFVTNRPDEHLLVINPRELSAGTAASIQAQIFNLFQETEWPNIEVKDETSVHSFAKLYYGTQVDSPELAHVLPKFKEKNHLGLSETLNAGQQVALPPVPIVPQGPSTPSIIQAIDLVERSVVPKDTNTGAALPYAKGTLDKSSSWVFAGPPSLLSALLSTLPMSAQKELKQAGYGGPTNQTAHLVLTSGSCACSGYEKDSGSDVNYLMQPQLTISSTALRYYVLDFFDLTIPPDACPHGKKVLDVIHQNLQSRGLEGLFKTNVIPIELDFFHHMSTQSHFIEDYIKAIGGPNQAFLSDVLADLKKRDIASVKPYETPILYLQAVYYAVLNDRNATVVSSSFYTESDTFNLLPDKFAQTSNVLVVSAVDDNSGDADTFLFEPIRGLYQRRRDFPVLLIGGLQKAGTTFGMTSAQGDGVSCLGYANGWGDATTCIRPPDMGTSFATPSVATMAFLARTAWLQAGQSVSAKDLRDRLLRAVNLLAAAPKGYISPGVPNLDWLLGATSGLLVDSSDHIFGLKSVTGSVGYTHMGSNSQFTVPFQRGTDGVSAIQQVGSATFIFDNGPGVWVPVQTKALTLSIALNDGSTKLIDLSDVNNKTFKVISVF
jgi:hypothetical protein